MARVLVLVQVLLSGVVLAQAPPAQFVPAGPPDLKTIMARPPAPHDPVDTSPADGGLFPIAPAAPPPPPLWKGSLDAGVNGATGNTEIVNTRFFFSADRKTDRNLLHTDATYLLGTQNGVTNQNTGIANVRDEILFPGSPWSIYGLSFFDYDELRDYRFILGFYGGLGYLLCNTDQCNFKLRAGAGTLYKTGGPRDLWEPSLNFGYDARWQIHDRGAIISVLDYYPTFDDFGDFLLRFKLAYEVTLDPASCLFLRLGIFERYDSSPGPKFNKSDLNYFASVGFNF